MFPAFLQKKTLNKGGGYERICRKLAGPFPFVVTYGFVQV